MNSIASKVVLVVALAVGVGGVVAVQASSPDAIAQHRQEVLSQCLKVSGLNNARPAGRIIIFGDDVGYDALMIRGNYPQPHMNNQAGKTLCLFNRQTRQAYSSDDRL